MNDYSPIVSKFGSEEEEQAYLLWLKAKVEVSRADPRPPVPHDVVMAEMRQTIADKAAKHG